MRRTLILAGLFAALAAPAAATGWPGALSASRDAPVFTTYAAAPARSEYRLDHAYQFMWFDDGRGLEFFSEAGGSLGIAFRCRGRLVHRLDEYWEQPVITASYSDRVRATARPFRDIRLNLVFVVHSSRAALLEVTLTNDGGETAAVTVYPLFHRLAGGLEAPALLSGWDGLAFRHREPRDAWMIEHEIPVVEDQQDMLLLDAMVDGWGGYDALEATPEGAAAWRADAAQPELGRRLPEAGAPVLALQKNLAIAPSQAVRLRVARAAGPAGDPPAETEAAARVALGLDLVAAEAESAAAYARIPEPKGLSADEAAVYWQAFSLFRQCLMPPEGKCRTNYYVFSREPRWGWGYGGQVFHESLVMLAGALMDPAAALDSQRVFIDRQGPDGYINYRSGPYLDETIPTGGRPTSAAPWFNWTNRELYRQTGDRQFLAEAYAAGVKFYRFWPAQRDTDGDGLCEWGGHGELESVRDARVAVWDRVDKPDRLEAADLNILLVAEADALADMAAELGLAGEAESWRAEARSRTERINATFWDPSTGFYYHVDKADHDFTLNAPDDLKVKEIIGFLALWAGVATPEQAARLREHVNNPATFRREFGVPSLAADDPDYNPMGYWNGPVWVPWQYLLFRGLVRYHFHREAKELADRVAATVAWQLRANHSFWEFYSADDRQAGWNRQYIWTALIARLLLERQQLR